MITEALINVFLFLPKLLLQSLPDIDISIPKDVFNTLQNFLLNLEYIFPIVELLPILVISISLSLFKIAWALVIRIKSFIPTMGA
ncbi:MAG TPA: hypothetical protein PLY69_08560 [Bacteroidales bacterium]|nr:hypothetical protein [Bacteroidales bacterium]